ncbi:MAG: hypothetical protein GY810_28005 [Aureispira sp.]|nr:hypothetical protein [Aureispira sp.]
MLKLKPTVLTPFLLMSILAILLGIVLFIGAWGIILCYEWTGYGESLLGGDGAAIASLMGFMIFGGGMFAYLIEHSLIQLYFKNDENFSRKKAVWAIQLLLVVAFFVYNIGNNNYPKHILNIEPGVQFFVVIRNTYDERSVGFSFKNYDKEADVETSGQVIFELEDKIRRHSDFRGSFSMLSDGGGIITTSKGEYWKLMYLIDDYRLSSQDSLLIKTQIEATLGKLVE